MKTNGSRRHRRTATVLGAYASAAALAFGCGQGAETVSTVMDIPMSGTPDADSHCKELAGKMKHPNNSSGVMFDEECKTVFVLPPAKGESQLDGIQTNTNLNFCPAVLKAGNVADQTLSGAETVAKKIRQAIADYAIIDKAVEALRKSLATAKATQTAADGRVTDATEQKRTLETNVESAKDAETACLLDHSPTECAAQTTALTEAKTELTSFMKHEYLPARQQARDAKREFDRLSDEITVENTRYTERVKPLLDLQGQLFDFNLKVTQLYTEYAKLEGLTGQISYTVPWDRLLQDYKAVNATMGDVPFATVKIIDGELFATAKTPGGANISLPALISSIIPGTKPYGIEYLKSERILPEGSDVEEIKPDMAKDIVGDYQASLAGGAIQSVGAQVRMSLTGACPYFPKGLDSQPVSTVKKEDLANNVTVNAFLTYEVKARRAYKAEYNLSNWVTRMEKYEKKGGLFSSSTMHQIIEDGNSSDWFKIKFNETASGFGYTPEEQEKITKEVKASLIDRAVRNLAVVSGVGTGPAPLPGLAPTGAGDAASKLSGGCWFWGYCRVLGWAFGVLDSIFGKQTAVSDFKKSNNVWTRDEVDQVKVLTRKTLITFGKLPEADELGGTGGIGGDTDDGGGDGPG